MITANPRILTPASADLSKLARYPDNRYNAVILVHYQLR